MEVQFVCPESADLSILRKEYPDLSHDETYDGQQSWWIGTCGDEYYDSAAHGYQYHDEHGQEEPITAQRDDSKEWMSADEAAEFCGFAEALIPDSDTMLEGNGPWAQGQLRSDPAYLKGKARAANFNPEA